MHNQIPPYLLRNITLNQPQSRKLRHYNEFNPPRCRLESYKNRSSQIAYIWNTLSEKIKKAENIRIFKKEIKIHLNMRNSFISFHFTKHFPLDHTHDGFFGKILTQIKLKLTPPRSQLFNYNLFDNPFCPACNDCIETPIHFFIDCHVYHVHRQTMLSRLYDLNPHVPCFPNWYCWIHPRWF